MSQISQGPNVLVVRTDAPFKSLNDIIDYAKANPGKLNYGTSGPGSVSHLSSEMLKNITKVQAVEVPYKGGVARGAGPPRRPDPVHLLRHAAGDGARARRQAARAVRDRRGEVRAAARAAAVPGRRAGPGRGQLVGRALSRPARRSRSSTKLHADTVKVARRRRT